jgi:hypothetical protein
MKVSQLQLEIALAAEVSSRWLPIFQPRGFLSGYQRVFLILLSMGSPKASQEFAPSREK